MELYIFSFLVASVLITPLALKTFCPFLWMDLLYCRDLFLILLTYVSRRRRRPFFFVLDRFLEQTAANPDQTFVVFENESYTYTDADKISNKTAKALQALPGYRAGDTVALFMGNEPAFIFTWLALTKLGSPVSFLNQNIRSGSLLHCFSCCGARLLIAASGPGSSTNKVVAASHFCDTIHFSLRGAFQNAAESSFAWPPHLFFFELFFLNKRHLQKLLRSSVGIIIIILIVNSILTFYASF